MRTIRLTCAVLLAACTAGSQARDVGSDPGRVVQALYDAFNRQDIDGVLAAYAPDGVLLDLPADTLARGTSEIRRHYGLMFTTLPRVRLEVRQRSVDGRKVVDELYLRGHPCGDGYTGLVTHEVVDGRIRSTAEHPMKGETKAVSIIPGVHVACPVSPAP